MKCLVSGNNFKVPSKSKFHDVIWNSTLRSCWPYTAHFLTVSLLLWESSNECVMYVPNPVCHPPALRCLWLVHVYCLKILWRSITQQWSPCGQCSLWGVTSPSSESCQSWAKLRRMHCLKWQPSSKGVGESDLCSSSSQLQLLRGRPRGPGKNTMNTMNYFQLPSCVVFQKLGPSQAHRHSQKHLK